MRPHSSTKTPSLHISILGAAPGATAAPSSHVSVWGGGQLRWHLKVGIIPEAPDPMKLIPQPVEHVHSLQSSGAQAPFPPVVLPRLLCRRRSLLPPQLLQQVVFEL